jgi:hypothetical protein
MIHFKITILISLIFSIVSAAPQRLGFIGGNGFYFPEGVEFKGRRGIIPVAMQMIKNNQGQISGSNMPSVASQNEPKNAIQNLGPSNQPGIVSPQTPGLQNLGKPSHLNMGQNSLQSTGMDISKKKQIIKSSINTPVQEKIPENQKQGPTTGNHHQIFIPNSQVPKPQSTGIQAQSPMQNSKNPWVTQIVNPENTALMTGQIASTIKQQVTQTIASTQTTM